jgi:NAD(P)H-hydrate epimerase
LTIKAPQPRPTLPYALYRASQVRELDRIAIEEYGIPGEALMERAGAAVFRELRATWPRARDITVLAGTGNNGGDGFVVARLAQEAGLEVRVLQFGDPDRIRGDARIHAERYGATGAAWEAFDGLPPRTDIIIDALLGTGLDRPVEGRWAEAIRAVNGHPAPVIAVDIPSGLNADTGTAMGEVVAADITPTFIALKQGLFTADGPAACGRVVFDALEVPPRVYARQLLAARRLDWAKVSSLLRPRSRSAHKGRFGHVLVVGGNHGFAGAARLAAEAAARAGAGLVSLATRPGHVAAVVAARPEIMVRGIENAADLDDLLARATVIAVGPGLGRDEWARALWQRVMATPLPLVVDADALNLLAEMPRRRDDWVLTPHPVEAARLLETTVAAVQADRFAAAAALHARFGGVAVLKGPGTLIHGGGTRPPGVCTQGNPGMASGGMGDVLTGLVAGLLAQGIDSETASELGVCLHGAAADRAARSGERGLLAGDLLAEVRPLVNPDSSRGGDR